jgi:hypothetical protein
MAEIYEYSGYFTFPPLLDEEKIETSMSKRDTLLGRNPS